MEFSVNIHLLLWGKFHFAVSSLFLCIPCRIFLYTHILKLLGCRTKRIVWSAFDVSAEQPNTYINPAFLPVLPKEYAPTKCTSILISSNKMQQYAGIYLLQNYSTCFGFLSHPSSGLHQTVTATSGTGNITYQGNDLYQRLQLQFDLLLGAIDTRNM